MSKEFDPYYTWLSIHPDEQPPSHYRLLGVRPFESDREVIRNAAYQRMTYLKTFATGMHSALSQQVLNEVAAAKVCLLDSKRKATYDELLRPRVVANSSPADAAGDAAVREAGNEETSLARTGDGETTMPTIDTSSQKASPKRRKSLCRRWTVVLATAVTLAVFLIIYYPPRPERPVLKAIPDKEVVEGEHVNQPLEVDNPGKWTTLEFSSRGDVGKIENNRFVWKDTEGHVDKSYDVTIIAKANGDPRLSGKTEFTIAVLKRTTPPEHTPSPEQAQIEIKTIRDQYVAQDGLLAFWVEATDTDTHGAGKGATLEYSISGAPKHTKIGPNTGFFECRPTEAEAGEDFKVTISVTKMGPNGTTLAKGTASFNLHVSHLRAGLVATLFDEYGVFAHPKETQIHKQVDWEWGGGPAGKGRRPDEFSIRWNGFLRAPKPGRYTLVAIADDLVRLWLNDELKIDRWYDQNALVEAEVNLTSTPIPIRIEFTEYRGAAKLSLRWRPPGGGEEVVPTGSLLHGPTLASIVKTELVPPSPDIVYRPDVWCCEETVDQGLLIGLKVITENDTIRSIQPIFQPDGESSDSGPSREAVEGQVEPINAGKNVESFAPITAKFVRFNILASNDETEPCIDEINVYTAPNKDGLPKNVALATAGGKAKASGSLSESEHGPERANDGAHGNENSWISNEPGKGSVTIELAEPTKIDQVVWGRDRTGILTDRTPVKYTVEVAETPKKWDRVASSEGRPYYGVAIGTVSPDAQGAQRESTVLLEPGYAIGAIIAQPGTKLDRFQVVFMRVKGNRLDPNDREYSKWVGRPSKQPRIWIGGTGQKTIGIQGRLNQGVIDAIGLIMAPHYAAAVPGKQAAGPNETKRESPAPGTKSDKSSPPSQPDVLDPIEKSAMRLNLQERIRSDSVTLCKPGLRPGDSRCLYLVGRDPAPFGWSALRLVNEAKVAVDD